MPKIPDRPREWEDDLEGWSEFHHWWPDSKKGPYEVRLTFAILDGRQECIGVNVRSFPLLKTKRTSRWQPQPVSTSILRSIAVGRLVDEIRDLMASETTPARYGARGELPAKEVEAIRFRWRAGVKGGRPPTYDVEHFVEVARIYNEANATNRTPTRAVARYFDVPQSTAAKWVARCRDPRLGLLPLTSRGKARGAAQAKRGRRR
jgi:hypothetical protein